jgi:hypothetical protein
VAVGLLDLSEPVTEQFLAALPLEGLRFASNKSIFAPLPDEVRYLPCSKAQCTSILAASAKSRSCERPDRRACAGSGCGHVNRSASRSVGCSSASPAVLS